MKSLVIVMLFVFCASLHAGKPDYPGYLQLQTLLGCRGLLSGNVPSEQNFVTASQTQELWFRQMLQELEIGLAAFHDERDVEALSRSLMRVVAINDATTAQLPLLKFIVSVSEFFEIRESFGGASGLQSQQFWRIYSRLGLDPARTTIPFFHRELAVPTPNPSLLNQVSSWLDSYPIPEDFVFADSSATTKTAMRARRAVAFIRANKNVPPHSLSWGLIESLHAVDISLRKWRRDHADLAKFYIDNAPGNAGTAGFDYLARTVEGYLIFSEIAAFPNVELPKSGGTVISRPIKFDGTGLGAFGTEPPKMSYLPVGKTVLSTRSGASYNVECLSLNPHCNGTHTETVGHIVSDEVMVNSAIPNSLIPAVVITIAPEKASASEDTYNEHKQGSDDLITAKSLRSLIQQRWHDDRHRALVIRTRAGEGSAFPPYFSNEAMRLIADLKLEHLLIDTPSVDRLVDGSELRAHHTYWKVPQGTTKLGPDSVVSRTITELISVPEYIHDGEYLLSIQIPDFQLTVAPSRPILFSVP